MKISKKPELGITFEISLTPEEVTEIFEAIKAGLGRTREGEQQEKAMREKYGDPIVRAVLAHSDHGGK